MIGGCRRAWATALLLVVTIGPLRAAAMGPRGLSPSTEAKIAPWILARTADGQQAEFLVLLSEQADFSGAFALRTKAERGRYVYDRLWATAQSTQAPLIRWLEARSIPYRRFYVVNALWVRGGRDVALALAARGEVARLEANPAIYVGPSLATASTGPAASRPAGVEENIAFVRAPEVWAAGYTGRGIVVAGQDTGYQWDHPALVRQYRGWDGVSASHDYNWHDAIHSNAHGINRCGHDAPVPCDDQDHGTHTMGIAVGGDGGGNRIGVAPGARWIGCRNMDNGWGTPATYLECFEFFQAPYPVGGTPAQGDPALAPDVTINSWSCPPREGCATETLRLAVEAQRAAGIMTVVSAGNSGPECATVGDPPAIYEAAYTVGALSTSSDVIADLSSRGPVTADGSGRRKPDLSAPGVSIRSSIPGGRYGPMTGTSMAGPHVAGAVALLWSAEPILRNSIDRTEEVLNLSAAHITTDTCGVAAMGWPNNVFGHGRLDIRSAVGALPARVYLPAAWR